jgi:hypothetical protein
VATRAPAHSPIPVLIAVKKSSPQYVSIHRLYGFPCSVIFPSSTFRFNHRPTSP